MKSIDCKSYEDIEDCYEEFWEWTIKEIECSYCKEKEVIEWKLNKWIWPIWLSRFIGFIYAKLDLQWEDINKLEDKDILPMTLDLIWDLLKEKKVKVQKYEIEEYEKPREIEKVMFW